MSSGKPKVLLLGAIETAYDAWDELKIHAQVVTPSSSSREGFLKEITGIIDLFAVYRTFQSASVTGPFNAELIAALPASCQFICHNGAGYDQIDVAACTDRKICVSNTPTAVNDSTADTGLFLLLGALRNFNQGMANLRRGQWRGSGDKAAALGHDPRNKVLGILGMGGIGRNMADKARAFGMKVQYHNRTQLSPEHDEGAKYVDFETLLRTSDVLSLNLPLNKHTRHTIGKEQLALMKPTAVLVNTARGAVIDEAALVDALNDGIIFSAGLDVFEDEPQIHPGLLDNERVMLVPHMGTHTIETLDKMERWAIGNTKKAVTEGKLKSIVPEQRELEKEL
ncbi:putative 2-hydroxyacid dehydrogenase-like protein [Emericellopsis cladophorae]|uniref:2-hydroxyacid dehydrogenase-like protein n=1 Tax=Emericellopsis cladophorae TaxID=2686198 RepID=A0A9P9XXL2_9HYPO|nr:putative 2-hydroxyacid dehydrogenase-like protein [Emericellopsis cladophorae]KAI6779697.1 putative 2-hydroxyacid dehydrogenase-like protein [Emericellopsis cladophorae]